MSPYTPYYHSRLIPVPQQESSCLPDTAGKTAAASFALLMTAAIALTVAILLPREPGLNTIFYPVFSVVASIAFIIFVLALYITTKKKTESPPDVSVPPFPMMSPFYPPHNNNRRNRYPALNYMQ